MVGGHALMLKMIYPGRVIILLCLFGVTWYLLQSTSSVTPVDIKKPLSEFPHQIGNYRLNDSFQSSAGVLELLGVDDYIQYDYVSDKGDHINLYVGYYRAVGIEGGYHSPKNCIPGGGWGINETQKVQLAQDLEGNNHLKVAQMLIRKGSEYQVVLYWFQNRGRIIASEYWEKIYQVWDALFMGRRDGSFVRIIAYVPDGDIEKTEKRVRVFATLALKELENHLPGAVL